MAGQTYFAVISSANGSQAVRLNDVRSSKVEADRIAADMVATEKLFHHSPDDLHIRVVQVDERFKSAFEETQRFTGGYF
jgi:hypothetical protein